MLFADATVYLAALVAITLAPGPLVLMLMVRAAGNDTNGAIGFGLGVAAGDVLVIAMIFLGAGTWLHSSPLFHQFGQAALLVYLLWLATKIWRGGFDFSRPHNAVRKGAVGSFCLGAVTCVFSPQTIGFYALMLPNLININSASSGDIAAVGLLTFFGLCGCFLAVICLSQKVRQIAGSPRHVTFLNRGLSCALVVAGMWMVFG